MAWQIAVFSVQAQNGKLKPWDEVQRKLFGNAEAPVAQSWQARKAERTQQMAQRKKHEEQRRRPLKVPRGR